jgi:hypothetical protein
VVLDVSFSCPPLSWPSDSEIHRSDWFRTYRDFFVPYEAHDLVFLGMRVAILRKGGVEFMDITHNYYRGVKSPQWLDYPRLEKLAKRCDECHPLGVFGSNANEFLLCYNGPCRFTMSMTCALIGWQSLGCPSTGTVRRRGQ